MEVISALLKKRILFLAALPVIGVAAGVALAMAGPALAATNPSPAPADTASPSTGSGSSTTHNCPNM